MKIAYVEIDTLLAKYNFCIDLNEAMVKKSENVRMTLNQKMTALNKENRNSKRNMKAMLSFHPKELSRNTIVWLKWNRICRN